MNSVAQGALALLQRKVQIVESHRIGAWGDDREDVKVGLKNLGDHCDEMSKEVEEEVEQRALELKFIRKMAEKHGVDENRIRADGAGGGRRATREKAKL